MLLTIWLLAMPGPALAGKCKVDWSRSDSEAHGRAWFDAEGRPLKVKSPDGVVTLEWGEQGLEALEGEARQLHITWEAENPVRAVHTQDTEHGTETTEDRWAWSGGVVGRWSRCQQTSWEEGRRCRELVYDYDAYGHLVRLTEPEGSHLLRWDMDQLVEHTWPSSGQYQRITWDGEGRIASLTDRTGEVEVTERYQRDEHGRVVRREVLAGEVLLDAEVAEYDGPRLVRVGRVQGDQTTWTRALRYDDEGVPVGLSAGEHSLEWQWKGPCEAAWRKLSPLLGIQPAPALPAYQAPWLRPDLDLDLPRIPGNQPPLEGLDL